MDPLRAPTRGTPRPFSTQTRKASPRGGRHDHFTHKRGKRAEGTIFVQVRLNPARVGKNYHTHEHPRGGGQGKKIGLRGRSRTRKGVLEIGPHFGPPPGPHAGDATTIFHTNQESEPTRGTPRPFSTQTRKAIGAPTPKQPRPRPPSVRTRTAPLTPILVYIYKL